MWGLNGETVKPPQGPEYTGAREIKVQVSCPARVHSCAQGPVCVIPEACPPEGVLKGLEFSSVCEHPSPNAREIA